MRTMTELTRRQLLLSLPPLAIVPLGLSRSNGRVLAQGSAPAIRARSLNHAGLAVADTKRSIDFYQGLFGMPVQSRSGTTTILRVGAGPQFLSIAPADGGTAPSITHYCLGVENFSVERVLAALAAHGVTKAEQVGPLKVSVTNRDGASDLLFGDPDGIVCQLQDVSYCGGSGPMGNRCASVQPSPKAGLLALKDYSHLTIFSSDAQRSNKFYQDLFGFSIRSYQGPTAPTLAVGPTVQFLMFTGPSTGSGRGGGAPGRANAAAPPRPASINHLCLNMDGFDVDKILKTLEGYGISPRGSATGPVGPMKSYVSMRMENRGGAKEGTPELYFTDPDGLLIQLQDVKYCGGSGYLGDECKPA
jgi:catechol 2,3-dioxygenase-like lactoylglutathione lyase family enzyme